MLTQLDNIWYYKGKIFVPTCLIQSILKECHDLPLAGHPGSRKTFHLISRTYWWPSMRTIIDNYVQSCDVCSRAKPIRLKPAGLLQPLPIAPHPWFSISMDLITDLPQTDGFDSILVVVDQFSKMAHFIPCKKTLTSTRLAELFIEHIVCIHGIPNNIILDRGPQFNSQFWKTILSQFNIKCNLSSAFHPQLDGQTECTNQTLEQYLWIYATPDQQNWVNNLALAELAYNSTYHNSIQMSPFMATYGFDPPANLDLELIPDTPPVIEDWLKGITTNHTLAKLNLEWTLKQMKIYANCKRCHVNFKVGDFVFLN